jgi:hypothetical protein
MINPITCIFRGGPLDGQNIILHEGDTYIWNGHVYKLNTERTPELLTAELRYQGKEREQ